MAISRAIPRISSRRRVTHRQSAAWRCRKKFLRFFPKGFEDPKYHEWERGYKWRAHEEWEESLNRREHQALLARKNFSEVAARAIRLESRTNLLFSFEKMAVRDAVKSTAGAKLFATELYQFLYADKSASSRFQRWVQSVAHLPRKQTRVLTWPVVTVFGFLAQPHQHIFLKPNVTRAAAEEYEFDFGYESRPSWEVYSTLLEFATTVRRDLADLHPRDMIDVQSFLWVLGSSEYAE